MSKRKRLVGQFEWVRGIGIQMQIDGRGAVKRGRIAGPINNGGSGVPTDKIVTLISCGTATISRRNWKRSTGWTRL